MKITTLKTAIVDKLELLFPNIGVYAMDTKQIKPPAFFVQLTPFGFDTNHKYHIEKTINVDIQYIPKNDTELECLDMSDRLLPIFSLPFKVTDRRLTLTNLEAEVIDNVLHFKFDVPVTDGAEAVIIQGVKYYTFGEMVKPFLTWGDMETYTWAQLEQGTKEILYPMVDLDEDLGYTAEDLQLMEELHLKEAK